MYSFLLNTNYFCLEAFFPEKNHRRFCLLVQQQGFVFRPKILVHAQDSCACTTLLCMHNTLVHALEGPGTKAGTQKKAAAGPARGGCFFLGPGLGPWPLQCMHKRCPACTSCRLYTADAADEGLGVALGGSWLMEQKKRQSLLLTINI